MIKPVTVPNRWLYLIAAILWNGVGVMLCRLAILWLSAVQKRPGLELVLVGISAAIPMSHFAFVPIAQKNIKRIGGLAGRVSVFAFQAPRGYLIIAFMMAFGFVLRHSFLPKEYLASAYEMIGISLILGSVLFYRAFWKAQYSHRASLDSAREPSLDSAREPSLDSAREPSLDSAREP
ncbi:MAG: hypothetical protein NTV54_14110 [Ignavibacteriales bacterium]|nr:hypothetical protein [Ignavibacteriales bacterium]